MIAIVFHICLFMLVLQCASKKKQSVRKLSEKKADVAPSRTPSTATPVQETPKKNEAVEKPKAAVTPAPVKTRRRKKVEVIDEAIDSTQVGGTTTEAATLCETQGDERTGILFNPSDNFVLKGKKEKKEEYLEDQNDDDTLQCVKSIDH